MYPAKKSGDVVANYTLTGQRYQVHCETDRHYSLLVLYKYLQWRAYNFRGSIVPFKMRFFFAIAIAHFWILHAFYTCFCKHVHVVSYIFLGIKQEDAGRGSVSRFSTHSFSEVNLIYQRPKTEIIFVCVLEGRPTWTLGGRLWWPGRQSPLGRPLLVSSRRALHPKHGRAGSAISTSSFHILLA